ncbi:hypothetical protein DVG80_04105 [Rhodococcus erythropolis]|nr:hypothetical protein DVG80_04105 [Rhodococcus erythropolis]
MTLNNPTHLTEGDAGDLLEVLREYAKDTNDEANATMFLDMTRDDLLAGNSTSAQWKYFDVAKGWVDRGSSDLFSVFVATVGREWWRRADEAKESVNEIAAHTGRDSDATKEALALVRTINSWARQCGPRSEIAPNLYERYPADGETA